MPGANQDAKKQRDVQGVTFDSEGFMDQVFTTVEANSSDLGTKPNELVNSVLNAVAKEKQESRLNVFYRMIGLPATRNVAKINAGQSIDDAEQKALLSQEQTLNYFAAADLGISELQGASGIDDIGDAVTRRESDNRRLLSPPKGTEDVIKMIEDPLSISESLNTTSRRISLIPMVVDAATFVVPLKKRVASLFHSGDFVLSGASGLRLPRPFIESVIYMRTQRFSEDMAEVIGELIGNLEAFVLGDLSDDEAAIAAADSLGIPEISSSGDSGAINTSLVEIEIINKFVQAIKKSAETYRNVIKRANELNKEVDFRPAPKDTPKEKAGNATVVIVGRENKRGIDKNIAEIDLGLERINALEAGLPTARVQQADIRYRLENCDDAGQNISPDVFISEFSNLVTFNRKSLEQRKQVEKTNRERKLNEFEMLKKQIQYFTGEFTGLSIFDILCVFLSLFTIDLNDLVSLLNQDAKDRLEASKFYNFNEDFEGPLGRDVLFDANERTALILEGLDQPVAQGLEALEIKVAEHFRLAEAFFTEAGKAGQNRG